jgi:S1-C subfamily serine protease
MSGGPVFDERGCVVGVVSHGMLPEDGTEPVGYAASIGGVAELKLDLELDDGSTRELTMPQLAEEIASP